MGFLKKIFKRVAWYFGDWGLRRSYKKTMKLHAKWVSTLPSARSLEMRLQLRVACYIFRNTYDAMGQPKRWHSRSQAIEAILNGLSPQ